MRDEVAEPVLERLGGRIEADEHEPLPGREPDGLEAVLGQAEVVEVVGVLGPDERPVEVVDPGVVRALEADGLAALLLDHGRAAMAADVVERAQHAVPCPDDDEWLVVDLGQEVRAGRRGVLLAPDRDPVAPEPFAALELVDLGVVIGTTGEQRRCPVRLADGGDLFGRERRARGHGRVSRAATGGVGLIRAARTSSGRGTGSRRSGPATSRRRVRRSRGRCRVRPARSGPRRSRCSSRAAATR